jgi:bacitracin transport system permease protein
MTSSRKIDILDVHQTIWRCRDFELTYLWQRSIFLTAFLVLCFTGYGFLLFDYIKIKPDESSDIRAYQDIIAFGISFVGFILSSLWIKMSKGSKAWYEKYEKAICAIETDERFIEKDAMPMAAFRYGTLKKYKREEIKNNLFIMTGGAFSPSKINIAIGQISISVWGIVLLTHFVLVFKYNVLVFNFVNAMFFSIIGVVFLVVFGYVLITGKWVNSGALDECDKDVDDEENNSIVMGEDDFLLYMYKQRVSCVNNLDSFNQKIWNWLEKNVSNVRIVEKNKECLWFDYHFKNNSSVLPMSANQFEFDRRILPDLYTFLDELANIN